MEALEMGAVNQVDESYEAMISGCKPCGDDYAGYKVEFWIPETMEIIEHHFTFSMNPAAARSDALPGTDYTMEDSSTGQDTSSIFCPLVGLDKDHYFKLYGHGNYGDPIDADHECERIKGKEIGVVIGKRYGDRGDRCIKAFLPVSDLSTMPVPD